jgi:hypothetical protein
MTGALGGVAVQPDGSNINPVALTLLNFKLPDGAYLIPTPQTVNPGLPFATQGFSAFTEPCHFNGDQFVTNVDYLATEKSKISGRFFLPMTINRSHSLAMALIRSGISMGFRVPVIPASGFSLWPTPTRLAAPG